MAVDDLPMPVVNLLNVIGVEWPYINEDTVSQFATLVREFATAVQTTHEDTTNAVHGIAEAYQGSSTQQMKSGWEELSARQVTEIVDACGVLADALEVATAYIVGQKIAAIGELISLAASFFADQAAAVATAGIAEAAVPAIIAAAKKVSESLVQDLEQYIIGKVVEAALKPLFAKLEEVAAGLDWSKSTPSSSPSKSITIDVDAVHRQTAVLRAHAATMRGHAASFKQGLAGLSF